MAKKKRRKIAPALLRLGFTAQSDCPPLRIVLFFNDLGDVVTETIEEALRQTGHQVMRIGYQRQGDSLDYLDVSDSFAPLLDKIHKFGPHLMVDVNGIGLGTQGLFAALAETEGCPLVVWMVDEPSPTLPDYLPPALERLLMLSYDRCHCRQLKQMGYQAVEHLPLGVSSTLFPLYELAPYWPLGFVGSLYERQIEGFLRRMELFKENLTEKQGRPYLNRLWALAEEIKGQGLTQMEIQKSLEESEAEFFKLLSSENRRGFLANSAAAVVYSASKFYRLYAGELFKEAGLEVWGSYGWKEALPPKLCHPAEPYSDLAYVYGDCKVNLSLSHSQNVESVTQRLFDVPMCGGFVLSDYRPGMEDLFEIEEELAVFHSLAEGVEMAKRFQQDDGARKAIAEKARQRVLKEHLAAHRVEKIMEIALERWPDLIERPRLRKSLLFSSAPEAVAPLVGRLAQEYLEAGMEKGGVAPLRELLASQEICRPALLELEGKAALGAQENKKALDLFQEAARLGGSGAHLSFLTGHAHLRLEGPGAARPFFTKATEKAPHIAHYWTTLAACCLELDDVPAARTALNWSLALHPNNSQAVNLYKAINKTDEEEE